MKKEKKFLDELGKRLVGISKKEKNLILLKYQDIIKTHKDNKERIRDILKEIGPVDEVAQKEIDEYKSKNSFKYHVNKLFNGIKTFVHNDLNKDKIKEEKRKEEKRIAKEKKKKEREEKKKIALEKKKLFKEEKAKAKKEKQNNSEKKSKQSFKTFLTKLKRNKKENIEEKSKKSFKDFLNKYKKSKKETVKDKIDKQVEEIHEEVDEIKEEIQEEISTVTDIATDTRLFETKSQRTTRIVLNVIKVIVSTILIFVWLWITVVFIASVFAYLDGVKFPGLVIALFGLVLLFLFLIIFINKSIFSKRIKRRWPFIFILLSVIIIACGIALGLRQIYNLNTTQDVSEKYNMTKKNSSYNLPSEKDKKLFITFNANYDTDYIVEYDDTINDKVNVEVKYYECYYDYFSKKDNNNLYISLRLDRRDRLSVYIDDFKEGKIYDNNELSMYVVKITMNERDKDRVIIK